MFRAKMFRAKNIFAPKCFAPKCFRAQNPGKSLHIYKLDYLIRSYSYITMVCVNKWFINRKLIFCLFLRLRKNWSCLSNIGVGLVCRHLSRAEALKLLMSQSMPRVIKLARSSMRHTSVPVEHLPVGLGAWHKCGAKLVRTNLASKF